MIARRWRYGGKRYAEPGADGVAAGSSQYGSQYSSQYSSPHDGQHDGLAEGGIGQIRHLRIAKPAAAAPVES